MFHKMLWWKELRENMLIVILGILVPVVLSSLMYQSRTFNYAEALITLNYIVLYPLFALLIGVNMISPELASDTLPFLLANPVKRWKIWMVKFFAGFFSLGFIMLFSTLSILLITRQGNFFNPDVIKAAIYPIILLYAIGFYTSTLFGEPMKATAVGLPLAIVIWASGYLLLSILKHYGFSEQAVMLLLFLPWATIFLGSSLLIFVRGGLLEGRGAVLKKVGRIYGMIAGAILLVGLILHTIFNYTAGKALKRELKEIRDSGAPLTLAELAPPLVPDEENAALLYQEAFALLQEGNEEEEEAFKSVTDHRKKPVEWSEENVLAIRSLLKKNEEALNLVQQATRLEKCRFPVEYEEGSAMRLPHLSNMRQLARLLSVKALLQNEEGKVEEALKSCQVGFQMGKSLLPEPILIPQLVRIAINAIMLQTTEIILNQGESRPAVYETLIKELDNLEGHRAFTGSLEGDRALGLWAFGQIRKEPSMASKLLDLKNSWTWLYGSYLLRPILKRDQVYYLRIMERTIALSRLPYYQAIAGVRDFKKEFGEELENVPRYCLVTRMLSLSWNKFSVIQARSEARIRAGKLALALKIYQAKKGTYPETLKALTPEILPQLPEDPFTGKDYIYRQEGEGFLVYSLGENLQDDQGTFDPEHREEGDIIWRCQN